MMIGTTQPTGISTCVGDKGFTSETNDGGGTSYLYCTKYTHTDPTCQVNYFEAEMDNGSGPASNWVGGVYSDAASEPGTKLAQITEKAIPASWAWDGGALGSTVTLENGVVYWFCVQGDASYGYRYETGAAGIGSYENIAYSATMPVTGNSGATTTRHVEIVVRYTP